MADNPLIMNTEDPAASSLDQLNAWLADLDQHGPALLEAVRRGRVRVMTAEAYAVIRERVLRSSQAHLDEAYKASELTTQNAVLTRTINSLLKSCERIAAQSDEIGELLTILPPGEALEAKTILGILMDARKRDTLVRNGKLLAGAFDSSWLGKIEVEALAPILAGAGIDFSAYTRLVEVLKNHLPAETQPQLPHG